MISKSYSTVFNPKVGKHISLGLCSSCTVQSFPCWRLSYSVRDCYNTTADIHTFTGFNTEVSKRTSVRGVEDYSIGVTVCVIFTQVCCACKPLVPFFVSVRNSCQLTGITQRNVSGVRIWRCFVCLIILRGN